VFVGGRGHERVLTRDGAEAVEFDDRVVLAECLREMYSEARPAA
jgi:ribosomal protein S28E/S33